MNKKSWLLLILFAVIAVVCIFLLISALYIVDPGIHLIWQDTSVDMRITSACYGVQADKSKYDLEDEIALDVAFGWMEGQAQAIESVEITIESDDFTFRLDCPNVIEIGTDGYQKADILVSQYSGKVKMEDIPFHCQLFLKPNQNCADMGTITILIKPEYQEEYGFEETCVLKLYFYRQDDRLYLSTESVEDAKAHGWIMK